MTEKSGISFIPVSVFGDYMYTYVSSAIIVSIVVSGGQELRRTSFGTPDSEGSTLPNRSHL